MKNKTMFSVALALSVVFPALADVEIEFQSAPAVKDLSVTVTPIAALANGGAATRQAQTTFTVPIGADGKVSFEMKDTVPSQYVVTMQEVGMLRPVAEFYAVPSDNIRVWVSTDDKGLNYMVTGTDLMDGISALETIVAPIEEQFARINSGQVQMSQENIENLVEQFSELHEMYVDINPDNPAAAYALLNIVDDDEFDQYLQLSRKAAEKSILWPLVQKRINSIAERQAAEARQKELASGTVDAPDFTFPNQKGKMVSLSKFRGKWVVLDFWGTWCRWCIKGIPDMKTAYGQHKDKAEFIGIDCGDTKDVWKQGLERYKMPWIQVYAGTKEDAAYRKLMSDYGIQGFPTKVIINPQGKIVDVVVGEDPAFYTKLNELIK